MIKKLFLIGGLSLLFSACVTIPHSAHPLGANAIEKPIAKRTESIAWLVPIIGGVAYYDVDPLTGDTRGLANSLAMRSYFGEAALSFSRPFNEGGLAAIGGGISGFGYSGRALGPEETLDYGLSRTQAYSGFGGRLNLSLDLNYPIDDGMIAWRILNFQYTYALESGRYSDYRQFVIDSNNASFFESEYFTIPSTSDFRCTQLYSEIAVHQGDFGLTFGLGIITYSYEDEPGLWAGYHVNGAAHLSLFYRRFYGKVNLGSIVPAVGPLPGPLSANMMLGYRYQF